MGSESKEIRQRQRQTLETQLAARQALLKEKSLSPEAIEKDTLIRRIKADLRKTDTRLQKIAQLEDLKKRLAEAKEKKLSAPKAEKEKKKKGEPQAAGETKKKKGKEKK
jgi:hypothetical protein